MKPVFTDPAAAVADIPEGATIMIGGFARTGTPFLDLTDAVRAAGVDRCYIPNDSHWNAYGHEVAANAVRPFVAQQVLGR